VCQNVSSSLVNNRGKSHSHSFLSHNVEWSAVMFVVSRTTFRYIQDLSRSCQVT